MTWRSRFCSLLLFGGSTLAALMLAADTPQGHAPSHTAPHVSADSVWADLMAGNARFVAGHSAPREFLALRRKLAQGQSPHAVILGCSDSRVGPELVFDKNLGDLFIVRSAGNIADAIGVGSIEYAVDHLGSSVIVVLGHEECGAVKAACSHEPLPTPSLRVIGAKIAPACSKSTGKDATHLSVVANVHQSAVDLLASSELLRKRVDAGSLTIIEAVYSLDSGKVTRLK